MVDRLLAYGKLTESDRELFRTSLNLLLTESFLIRSLDSHARCYRFTVANFDLMESYLALAGWGLKKDEHLGVVSFAGPPGARLQLKKDESILLLVLRLLYGEKAAELAIHGERTVRQQEIQDRLRMLAEISFRKTPFVNLLRRFQALRLIRVVGPEEDPESTVILYPSIPFALDEIALEETSERITAYQSSAEEEDEES